MAGSAWKLRFKAKGWFDGLLRLDNAIERWPCLCRVASSLCLNWTANFGRSGGGGFTLKEQSTEQMDGRIEREERYFGATFDSGAQTFADSSHSSFHRQMNLTHCPREVGMPGVALIILEG